MAKDACTIDISVLEEFLQVHFSLAVDLVEAMKGNKRKKVREAMAALDMELEVFKSAVSRYLIHQATLCVESRKGRRK
jgi:hypothetical protein